ncbi:MAG: outer membrane protein [Xanthobacteraceae bacterium]
MKQLLALGVAISVMACGAVRAADLPAPVKAPLLAPVTAYDWSGIYIGAHLGGGWSTNDISDPSLGFLGIILGVPPLQTARSTGFLGGGEAGWNYQIGRFVVGTEYDASWTDLKANNTATFTTLGGFGGGTINRALGANTDWTATSTVRLGLAQGPWLFYSKVGAALAHTSYTDTWTAAGLQIFTGNASQTKVGWTVGTGLEWGFMTNWSAKLEYDYIDMGSKTVPLSGTINGVGLAAFSLVNSQAISLVKVGVNYRLMPLP